MLTKNSAIMVKFSKPATKEAIKSGSKYKGAFIPKVLGATKEFKHHIYVINPKTQAEKYLRTTEMILEYAGLYISKEMRIVALTGKITIAGELI